MFKPAKRISRVGVFIINAIKEGTRMKKTRLKISVSQDGLLPEETVEITTLPLPILPKKLIRALGFERVDTNTFVGVVPVFVKLGTKEQEIEIELGVDVPEMRKKIIELIRGPQPVADSGDEYSEGGSQSNVINMRKKAAKRPKKTAKTKKNPT